jgi:putative FmdB family regulatory protein
MGEPCFSAIINIFFAVGGAMPIYEYRCSSCGFQKEYLRKVSDPLLSVCPACSNETFGKMLTSAGFHLKGGGWYVTDFKGSGARPAARTDGQSETVAKAEGKSETSSESKSEGKSESKSEGKSDSKSERKSEGKSDSKTVSRPAAAAAPTAPASTVNKAE